MVDAMICAHGAPTFSLERGVFAFSIKPICIPAVTRNGPTGEHAAVCIDEGQ